MAHTGSAFRDVALSVAMLLTCLRPMPLPADLLLVTNGQPNADIVIATNPPRMTIYAAHELAGYLRRISGATLDIVTAPGTGVGAHIYVGQSTYTDARGLSTNGLLYGAFRIASGANWLALLGFDHDYAPKEPYADSYGDIPAMMAEWDALTGATWGNPTQAEYMRYCPLLGIWDADERGSLNAVHEYLRSLGCRWFFPGELGEVVPRTNSIVLPDTNTVVHPDFPVREPMHYYCRFGDARASGLTTTNEIQWQLRQGLYRRQPVIGWSLAHGTIAVHGRDEVKAAHTNYYAIWGGERQTNWMTYGASCLSSEGLFTQNVAYARAAFDIYDLPMVGVGPNDGYIGLCECSLCAGKDSPERGNYGKLSDYVWAYANRVAQEVYTTHPTRKIGCPAYSYYRLPPTNIATLCTNVVIGWCQWRSEYQDEAAWTSYTNEIAAWMTKLPSKQMYRYDYYLHSSPTRPWWGIPVYYPHSIARDLSFLKGKSLGDHIEVYRNYPGNNDTWHALAVDHLNCYVTARLWWDADQDVDALLNDYYAKFYGPAANEMKAFVGFCETNWPTMKQAKSAMDEALALLGAARAAAGSGVYGERVNLVVEYVKPMVALRDSMADHFVAQAGQTPLFPYTNWVTAASNIQEAIRVVHTNATIRVGPGRYTAPTDAVVCDGTNVVYIDKPLFLRAASDDPADTVIDGQGLHRGIMMDYNVTWPITNTGYRLLVDGLTVSNGYAVKGGGIRLEPHNSTWTGIVMNCVVTDNASPNSAGGVYAHTVSKAFSLAMSNSVVRGNTGGGLYSRTLDGGTFLTDCAIEGNTGWGAYLYSGVNELERCVIRNNTFTGNYGAGLSLWYGTHRLRNCLICGNRSGAAFGGAVSASACAPEWYNCTIVSNTASASIAGVYTHHNGSNKLWNSIVYFNNRTGGIPSNFGGAGVLYLTNCCTAPITAFPAAGNLDLNPGFFLLAEPNFRLHKGSPCIDTGTNQPWMEGAFDLDGYPRKDRHAGLVDRGCYEFVSGGTLFKYH